MLGSPIIWDRPLAGIHQYKPEEVSNVLRIQEIQKLQGNWKLKHLENKAKMDLEITFLKYNDQSNMTVQMSNKDAYLQMNTITLWRMSQKELKERFDKNKIIYYFDNVILKDGEFGKIIEETRSGAKTYKLYDSWDEIKNSHKGLWDKFNLERESIEYNKKTQELLKNQFNNQGNPSYSYACYSENIKVTEGIHGIIALIKDEYWKFPNWDYIKINYPGVYEQYEKLQEKLTIEKQRALTEARSQAFEEVKATKVNEKSIDYDKMLEYCKNNERYIQDFLPTTIYHFNLKKPKSVKKVILKDKIFTTEKGIVINDLKQLIHYVDSWF